MRIIVVHGSMTDHNLIIHDNGHIERNAPLRVCPSANWRITGAVTRNNFGHVVRRYSLQEVLDSPHEIPWLHANGKQKTRLTDFDHGTEREWGGYPHEVF